MFLQIGFHNGFRIISNQGELLECILEDKTQKNPLIEEDSANELMVFEAQNKLELDRINSNEKCVLVYQLGLNYSIVVNKTFVEDHKIFAISFCSLLKLQESDELKVKGEFTTTRGKAIDHSDLLDLEGE